MRTAIPGNKNTRPGMETLLMLCCFSLVKVIEVVLGCRHCVHCDFCCWCKTRVSLFILRLVL